MAAQFITTPEAAELIGVDISCIRKWIITRMLPAKKIGRDWWVSAAAVRRIGKKPASTGRPRGAKNKTAEKVTA